MRIEVYEAQRTSAAGERAQQRQGYRMVAAERDEVRECGRLFLKFRQRRRDVAMDDAQVADIGKIERGGTELRQRMLFVRQHAARLPGRRRPQPRSRTVRGAEIEGHAGDNDRRIAARAQRPEKARTEGIGRRRGHAS
jgi:hypothetical protein